MKVLWFIVFFILSLLATVIVAGQVGLLKGWMPKDLGVKEGRLKAPSPTPNSVSSQADLYPGHPQLAYARIAPFAITGNGAQAIEKIAHILKNTEGTVLVTQEPGYLYAQSTSQWLKFTDDVEFWLDTNGGVIQVRSASRLGHGDRGVNRARVEAIRAQFTKP